MSDSQWGVVVGGGTSEYIAEEARVKEKHSLFLFFVGLCGGGGWGGVCFGCFLVGGGGGLDFYAIRHRSEKERLWKKGECK